MIKYLLPLLLINFLSFSQNTTLSGTSRSNSSIEKYERNSVTYILLNTPGSNLMPDLVSSWYNMQVADKYNNHNLPTIMVMDVPYTERLSRKENALQIVKSLNTINVGREVIRKWFNQQKDGKFNMDLVKDRGVYNATDAEIIRSQADNRGRFLLEDAGENLINNTFVVVLDFRNVETIAEYYQKRKQLAADALMIMGALSKSKGMVDLGRTVDVIADINLRPGYRATIDSYVYKLDWTEEKSAIFYQQVWNKPQNLDTMNIPISFLTSNVTIAENTDLEVRPLDEFLTELMSKGAEFSMNVSTNSVEALRVRTQIHSIRPITAKVGLKEGLSPDQRYLMVENTLDEYGQPKDHIIGVARVTRKIVDNRTLADGNSKTTRFKQESGRAPYPGLKLVQKNDAGIGISVGLAPLQLGLVGRFELKITRLLQIPQLKLYFDFDFGGKINTTVGAFESSQSYSAYSLGIAKEYFILRNIHIEPFVGFQSVSFESSTNYALNAGLRIPINLLRGVQIVPSVAYTTLSQPLLDSFYFPLNIVLRFKF